MIVWTFEHRLANLKTFRAFYVRYGMPQCRHGPQPLKNVSSPTGWGRGTQSPGASMSKWKPAFYSWDFGRAY